MWKIWVSLVVIASVALYFWMGGEDSTDGQSQPPVAASEAGRAPAVSPAAQKMAPQQQSRPWELGGAYGQRVPAPNTGSMYGIYPAQGAYSRQPASTQDYRFRPLTQSEKARLEQGGVSAPPMIKADPAYRGGPSTRYPDSGYAATGYPSASFPDSGYSSPMDRQAPPTPTYKFREFDSEKASKRWTGDYPPPSQTMPRTLPDQTSPYAPGWRHPSPYQSRPLPNEGPLWAAEGVIP